MKKALVIGIDYYEHLGRLHGCVNDAYSVKSAIERNGDGSVNFGVLLMTSASGELLNRFMLREAVKNLFADKVDVALFYFAGHGYIDSAGGYLCGSDVRTGDDGLSLREVLSFANKSPAQSKIIILDSCHSGVLGSSSANESISELSEGLTILTASTAEQYADEKNGCGVFTNLLVDALGGAAANLMGDITPGSVYAHVDQSLGPWQQRPLFKTNVRNFTSLRRVQPPISLADLLRIAEFFPEPGYQFQLDPDYEPKSDNPDPHKTAIFAILQKYNRINLVVPNGEEHMYYAAINRKSCHLTSLGEHYRRLVVENRI